MDSDEYPASYFESIGDLCDQILNITKKWEVVWYRGLPSSDFKLIPSIFRGKRVHEHFNSIEFRRRARLIDGALSSQFDFMCLMQHHGLPTRLLDWTESLSVALYFSSCGPYQKGYSPTIWLLGPFQLGKLNGISDVICTSTDDDIIKHCDIAFNDFSNLENNSYKKYPVPVLPDFMSRRLAAQEGVFTIHGTDKRPVEDTVPKSMRRYLRKLVAKNGCEGALRKQIRLVMPNGNSMFPDIDGIGKYLADHGAE
ncbi:MAG: FRG domain-containing protein [Bosea sp.]|uniref:FRG domain-containing protein n=1 Tax=Bosea sp. (in: a-proteobacteria) TaxID=1871050 RepID=UPI001AC6FEAE|nr:FRG domain-containing protein [Bosea sp. (in: a-proteobacteria)]MBN9469891.1 FRG domain-containing protein [Bosea sp. (in: a-proteobacteria)]